MAGQHFTLHEQEKATILQQAINGDITNAQAAKQLGLSIRQVQRAKAAIRTHGVESVIHGLKGKPSNHRIAEQVKQTSLTAIRERYADFKPTFATEKLAQYHGIFVSAETTRLWMMKEGLWKSRKQKKSSYHAWRPRRQYFGELEQFDGSYHYWLEDRYKDGEGNPIELCLLASIDDATGKITKASFLPNEGVVAVFTFWKEYVVEYGKPVAIYLDAFSTYKITHKSAEDNKDLKTQFERATGQLSIRLITAHSPEAKGRVERLFETLQDRLVKEMRLAGITTPEEANIFLTDIFLPWFNNRFSVIPAKTGNVHRTLLVQEMQTLSHILSTHHTRVINNDFTIQFHNKWYQLQEVQPTTVRGKEKVIMETWLDGSVHIMKNAKELISLLLPEKPQKQNTQPPILTTHKLNWVPPKDHPWRKPKG